MCARQPKNRTERRLLVIEQDAATREGMKRLLEMNGYSVTTAADEREATRAAERGVFDLILLDSDLPPPQSLLFAYRVSREIGLKNTPLVVISVHERLRLANRHEEDHFSVAFLTETAQFTGVEKLIDCLIPAGKANNRKRFRF